MKCIKNDMVHHSKPNTLVGLPYLTQATDTCYWEQPRLPMKLTTQDPPETNPNRNPTPPNPSPVQKWFFAVQAEQQQLWLYPEQGYHF